MKKILIADDEILLLQDRSKFISALGYQCLTANNGAEAIEIIHNESPDVIFTDIKMPQKCGFDVLEASLKKNPDVPVILFTGFGTVELAVQAIKRGAFDYIQKPFTPARLESALKKALAAHKETKYHNLALNNFVAQTPIMNELCRKVNKAAQAEANVFIFGESGTGKELIAQNIHQLSKRKDGVFIPVDCVAMPASLIESELFGFERGAFTGAITSKPGLMELAHKGTLFLDEITELDINLQAKLLRVLQERKFRKIGSKKMTEIDIRIISATNRDPEEAVSENKLRKDLYYRLNVIPVHLPPLRDHKGDIPALVHYFMEQLMKSCQNTVEGISPSTLDALMQYDWPGNVRELQNVIQQVYSMTDNRLIEPEDLPEKIFAKTAVETTIIADEDFKEARQKYLDQFTKQYLAKMMRENSGNISRVARLSGLSRRTIYRMLQEYKIQSR